MTANRHQKPFQKERISHLLVHPGQASLPSYRPYKDIFQKGELVTVVNLGNPAVVARREVKVGYKVQGDRVVRKMHQKKEEASKTQDRLMQIKDRFCANWSRYEKEIMEL